jgi:hypothetical protein
LGVTPKLHGLSQLAVTIHKPKNKKQNTYRVRIANDDKATGWITLHFDSLEVAREVRTHLKKVIKVGAHNM